MESEGGNENRQKSAYLSMLMGPISFLLYRVGIVHRLRYLTRVEFSNQQE